MNREYSGMNVYKIVVGSCKAKLSCDKINGGRTIDYGRKVLSRKCKVIIKQ